MEGHVSAGFSVSCCNECCYFMLCDLALEVRRPRRLKSCLRTNWFSRRRLKNIFRVMKPDHSLVMRVFVEYDIGKGIAWQPVSYKMKIIFLKKWKKTVSNVSLDFLPSLQSAVCILYLVCILYPVCSLQSAFCTDRIDNCTLNSHVKLWNLKCKLSYLVMLP